MLANVFAKTTRERLPAALTGAGVVAVFLLFSMWVYGDIDTSFYYDLPAAVLDLMGINPDGSGTGGIAYGAIYNMIGAFVVAGLAISFGAGAIAGEEQDGTLGLLLANPLSRGHVVVSKALSVGLVVGLMSALLWLAGIGAAWVLSVPTAGLFVGSLIVALFLNSLFYGFLAMAIGGWTGHRGLASGVSAGVMVIGYLAAALLPLADIEWLARFFPWYYFSASDPVNNGLDWTHAGVLAGLSVVCFVVAYVGVQRRDLKEKGTGVTVIDRLRENPLTQKVAERVAGSTRVSRLSAKAISDHQTLFAVTAAVVFYMGVLIPPLYNFIPEEFLNIFSTFPDALIAMVGGVDMSTATGFLTGEVFSLVVPIAVIVLTVTIGSRSLAGEEEKRTMDLLLSNPISRAFVIREKTLAMVVYATLFGVVTFVATWIGVRLGGLDEVSTSGIASISFLTVLFGLTFGGIALLLSAATGKRATATLVTTGVAVVAWFVFSFFPLSPTFEPIAAFSPFHWYLGTDPLLNGMDWTGAALMAATTTASIAASVPLFQRRDLG